MQTIISNSPEQTRNLAASLAKNNSDKRIICLFGDLGSGKTEFTKGYASSLGIPERKIKSPTFTYFRQYKLRNFTLYHFDFYRIEQVDELIIHEMEEILSAKNTFAIIEWPERIIEYIPKERTCIFLEYLGENKRKITLE